MGAGVRLLQCCVRLNYIRCLDRERSRDGTHADSELELIEDLYVSYFF